MKTLLVAVTFAALVSTLKFASAEEGHHGAHVHGEAEASVVVEGNDLTISLFGANYNFLGFERAPQTDAEQGVLASTVELLGETDNLFEPSPAAGCVLEEASNSLETETPEFQNLEASYLLVCSSPDQLSSLKVNLFSAFPKLEKLNAVFISGARQDAAELTPDASVLVLAND